jgi:hypothetical protein
MMKRRLVAMPPVCDEIVDIKTGDIVRFTTILLTADKSASLGKVARESGERVMHV